MIALLNYPGYYVTDKGQVYSHRKFGGGFSYEKPPRKVKGSVTNRGYVTVILTDCDGNRMQRTVHSLVLEAYVGPRPEGMVSRHLDSNKQNNALSNLAWGTNLENAQDRILHGTQVRGETQWLSKITDDDVRAIRHAWNTSRIQQKELAEQYGITQSNVSCIVKRLTWKHIEG